MGWETPEVKRAAERLRAATRRSEWLAMHPCGCGNPSAFLHPSPKIWTHSQEKRAAALAGVTTFCVECEAANIVAQKARTAAVRKAKTLEYHRARRDRLRPDGVPKREFVPLPTKMDLRKKRPVKKPRDPDDRPKNQMLLFTEASECEFCGDKFPRVVLKVRHQRTECMGISA